MPRPDSTIMKTRPQEPVVAGSSNTDAVASTAAQTLPTDTPPVRAKRGPKPGAKLAAMSPAEKKAKIKDLQAALKLAGEPLAKLSADDKAHEKNIHALAATKERAMKEYDKGMTALDKVKAKRDAQRTKFQAAFDKTAAKLNAQIEQLKA